MKKYFIVFVLILFAGGTAFTQTTETLTIEKCIKTALKSNPTLKSARFQYDIAKSQKLSSYSRILPFISTGVSSGETTYGKSEDIQTMPVYDPETGELLRMEQQRTVSPKYSYKSYGFSLNYQHTLFDGGAWWNQIKQGSANKDAFYFNFINQTITTIALVKQRYYELLSAMDNLEVLEDALKVAEEQLARVESMYEVGSSAQADVYRAKIPVGNEKINIIQQKRLILLAKNNLNIAIGREINEPLNILKNIKIDKSSSGSLDNITNNVLENNLNIRSLEKNVKVSEYGMGVAKGSKYPGLGYSVSYSRGNVDRKRVFTTKLDEDFSISVRLSINYTIFNGFQRRTNIIRQEKNYQISKETLINAKRQLLSEVNQTHNNIRSFLEIIEINQDNIKSAEEDLRYAQERYAIGSGTLLEVNTAQVNLRRARYMFVSAQYDLMIEKSNLNAQMGNIEQKYLDTVK